jgi:hypothetical protein
VARARDLVLYYQLFRDGVREKVMAVPMCFRDSNVKRLAGLLLTMLMCVTSGAYATVPHWVFTYEMAGGLPGATHYLIQISDSGKFSATTEGLPLEHGHMKRRNFSKIIPEAELRKIIDLAVNAHDFVNNPEEIWPDFTWAEMMVINGREKIIRRSGPIDENWAEQPQTKSLRLEIEKNLPDEMLHLP